MKAIAFSSCMLLAATASATTTRADVERQIRGELDHWVEAMNQGDRKKASSIWAPDLVGWAPIGADDTYAREKAAAEQPVEQSRTQPPKTTFALKIDEIMVDKTLAVVRDTWTQTEHKESGDSTVTFRSFEIWREQPDKSWKISRWIDGPPQHL